MNERRDTDGLPVDRCFRCLESIPSEQMEGHSRQAVFGPDPCKMRDDLKWVRHALYDAMEPRRLMLTEDDFRSIVKGGIVRRDGVVVALSDIGWDVMNKAIRDAHDGQCEPLRWNTDR